MDENAKRMMEQLKADPALMKGLNTYKGHLTCRAVAEAQNLTYTDPATLL